MNVKGNEKVDQQLKELHVGMVVKKPVKSPMPKKRKGPVNTTKVVGDISKMQVN